MQGDAFEALEACEALLDAGAGFVEGSREESRLVFFFGFVRNHRSYPSRAGRLAGCLASIALVANDGARFDWQ